MIRGIIIVKAAHVEEARTLAQQPPFSISAEMAAAFLVPANPVYSGDGMTVTTPATLYWASGDFEDAFWTGVSQAAAALDWGGVWEYDIENNPTFPHTKLAEVEGQTTFSKDPSVMTTVATPTCPSQAYDLPYPVPTL